METTRDFSVEMKGEIETQLVAKKESRVHSVRKSRVSDSMWDSGKTLDSESWVLGSFCL